MPARPLGKLTASKLLQLRNVSMPMVLNVEGKVSDVMLSQ